MLMPACIKIHVPRYAVIAQKTRKTMTLVYGVCETEINDQIWACTCRVPNARRGLFCG